MQHCVWSPILQVCGPPLPLLGIGLLLVLTSHSPPSTLTEVFYLEDSAQNMAGRMMFTSSMYRQWYVVNTCLNLHCIMIVVVMTHVCCRLVCMKCISSILLQHAGVVEWFKILLQSEWNYVCWCGGVMQLLLIQWCTQQYS